MDLINEISNLVDSDQIRDLAEEGVAAWEAQGAEGEEKAFSSSSLEFVSHKLCFKSSLLSYAYFESTFNIINNEVEVGRYRLITLLDGSVDDDYYEIY